MFFMSTKADQAALKIILEFLDYFDRQNELKELYETISEAGSMKIQKYSAYMGSNGEVSDKVADLTDRKIKIEQELRNIEKHIAVVNNLFEAVKNDLNLMTELRMMISMGPVYTIPPDKKRYAAKIIRMCRAECKKLNVHLS